MDREIRATALAFSKNGKFLAVGSNDGRVALWDCSTVHVLAAMLDPRWPDGVEPGVNPARADHPWNRVGYGGSNDKDGESGANGGGATTTNAVSASGEGSFATGLRLSAAQRMMLLCRGVTSVSWSADSCKLLVGYAEQVPPAMGSVPWYERWEAGRVCLWDVDTQTLLQTVRLDAPVLGAALHPHLGASPFAVASLQGRVLPLLLRLQRTTRSGRVAELQERDVCALSLKQAASAPPADGNSGGASAAPAADTRSVQEGAGQPSEEGRAARSGTASAVAFNATGDHIFYSSTKGTFSVAAFDVLGPGDLAQLLRLVHREVVSGGGIPVPLLTLSNDGRSLICGSRAGLRQVRAEAPFDLLCTFSVKLGTPISWSHAQFSGDNTHILGVPSSHRNSALSGGNMCVWDDGGRGCWNGEMKLVKPLEGGVRMAVWNPCKPMIAACDKLGSTFMLQNSGTSVFPGAHYPPSFFVVNDNVEYVELEDEFDIPDRSKRRRTPQKWGLEAGVEGELKRHRHATAAENEDGAAPADRMPSSTDLVGAEDQVVNVVSAPTPALLEDAELQSIPSVPCCLASVDEQAEQATDSGAPSWLCSGLLPPLQTERPGEPVTHRGDVPMLRRCSTPDPPKPTNDRRKQKAKKSKRAVPKAEAAEAAEKVPMTWATMCQDILQQVMQLDSADLFHDPVDPIALQIPDYFTIVTEPMDLGSVKKKLRRGRYNNTHEFAEDVRLTFKNAQLYNGRAHPVSAAAANLRDAFEENMLRASAMLTEDTA
jgi:hypothetical protein